MLMMLYDNEIFLLTQTYPPAETKQRSYLLLPVPNSARSQVHPLGERPAPGSEAEQPAAEHDL